MERYAKPNGRPWPACVGMEQVAAIFGWPNYYIPFLVRAGHLKPLFISAGSHFPSSASPPPTLTIVALALRQADYLPKQVGAGTI